MKSNSGLAGINNKTEITCSAFYSDILDVRINAGQRIDISCSSNGYDNQRNVVEAYC